MEVSPVEMACVVSKSADSGSGLELQHNTADLQPAGEIDMSNEGSARLQLDPGEFRSSDRAAGQRQVAADLRTNGSIGIRPGRAAGVGTLPEPDPEQARPPDGQTAAPVAKLGPEVGQELRQRADSIILARGFMVLIADKLPIAEILQNKLLLLVFQLVQTLDAPLDAPWAKRAFLGKMLAMLLASAVGLGEIELGYAEAEGKRLTEQAKVVQATVTAMEKAARRAGKEDTAAVQIYLAKQVSAFKSLVDARPELTDAELMPPPPPPPPSPPTLPPPLLLPLLRPSEAGSRPPPVSVPEEDPEFESARWLQFYQFELDVKEAELKVREQNLEWGLSALKEMEGRLLEQLMPPNIKRGVREQLMLEREIRALEEEVASFDAKSGNKRLREEWDELRGERDELRGELSREEAQSRHFARVCDRLRAERDDARSKLATAHADVDDLLEFKASTSLEAQRRLMCPRD